MTGEGSLDRELSEGLAERQRSGLFRRLERSEPGLFRADFTTNDYLGLSRDPEVARAASKAALEHGAGGRASRLLGGGSPLDEEVEQALALWLGSEAALLFPSGFQANVGLVSALAAGGDAILSDEKNHASLIDAARLSRARIAVYGHLALEELEQGLVRAKSARRRFVLTESVFSMDGDLAPLAEIHGLCVRHDAWLIVDEAHAAGLLGPEGSGAWALASDSVPGSRRGARPVIAEARLGACLVAAGARLCARLVTGGKALGAAGGLVAANRAVCEHLVNHARSFVYTTAVAPAVSGALRASISICRRADALRRQALSHARALASELDLPEPAAAIVPVPMPSAERALSISAELESQGFYVRAVRPPTAPTSRLRIVCHSFNTDGEVQELARALRRLLSSASSPRASAHAEVSRMARVLFVVGTDTGVGKTVVSAALCRAASAGHSLRAAGAPPVSYWKPVQTGTEGDSRAVRDLAGLQDEQILPSAYVFSLAASPHEAAAAASHSIEPTRLASELAVFRGRNAEGTILVELAGGLCVPLTLEFSQADWLARERPPLVLVARSGLGTLNHTQLTLEALRARRLEPRALFLVGKPHKANRDALEAIASVPRIFELPLLSELSPASLDQWLAENDVNALFRR